MARATVTIGEADYASTVAAGRHRFVVDEPAALGGADAGPAPYDLLLGALGACTAITLKMYAGRKGWALRGVGVDLAHAKTEDGSRITRVLSLDGDLDAGQRARLAEIAERTPVTLTLKAGAAIETRLADTHDHLDAGLDEALDESFPASDPPSRSEPGAAS